MQTISTWKKTNFQILNLLWVGGWVLVVAIENLTIYPPVLYLQKTNLTSSVGVK
jgi:hypothetical protein